MILLPQGPFPIDDSYGAVEAIRILWRSLDPGQNSQRIQFDTSENLETPCLIIITPVSMG